MMGVIDEHWCSECKREIDKSKDKYIETTLLNDKDDKKFDRVFLCVKCAKKKKIKLGGREVSVWSFIQKLRKRGNPSFEIAVTCHSAPLCSTYRARRDQANCRHIAVTPAGHVYCKRNHPGGIALSQEKALVERYKVDVNQEMVARYCRKMGFDSPGQALETLGFDPRSLIQPTHLRPIPKDAVLSAVTVKKLQKGGSDDVRR